MTGHTLSVLVSVALIVLGIAVAAANVRVTRAAAVLADGAMLRKLQRDATVVSWCFYFVALSGLFRVLAGGWPGLG